MSSRTSPEFLGVLDPSTSLSGSLVAGNGQDVYAFTLDTDSNLLVTAAGVNFSTLPGNATTAISLGRDLDNDGVFDNNEAIASSGLPLRADLGEVFEENLTPGTYFLSFSARATDLFQVGYETELAFSDSTSASEIGSTSEEDSLGLISADVSLTGQLSTGGVRDNYSFSLDDSSRLNLSFIGDADNAANNVTTILYQDLNGDSSYNRGEEIELFQSTANETISTGFVELTAGDYGVALLSTRDNPTDYAIAIELESSDSSNGTIGDFLPNPVTPAIGGDDIDEVISSDDSLIRLANNDNPLNVVNVTGGLATPTFADVDGDGDADAFVGDGNGNLDYFENDGEGEFILVTGAANPLNGLRVGPSSAPTFVDVDSDGDLDAFIGSRDGTIDYFENDGDGNFTDIPASDNPLSVLNGNGTDNTKPTFADLDGDGDEDAVVGVAGGIIRSFDNNGSGVFTELLRANNPFDDISVDNNSAPALADIDGDGDLDAVVGAGDGTLSYFENDSEGSFEEVTGADNLFDDIDIGRQSAPTFADLDGDGVLELVVGTSSGTVDVFESAISASIDTTIADPVVGMNPPMGSIVELTGSNNPLNVVNVTGGLATPTFADVDGDDDADAFVGDGNGNLDYFENDGEGEFTLVTGAANPLNGLRVGLSSAPTFVDADSDGDLDAFIGSRDGTVDYFENDGDGNFTDIPASDNPLSVLNGNGIDNTKPTFADLDGDGDEDAVVGVAGGIIRSFDNNGSGVFTELVRANNPFNDLSVDNNSAPAFADTDGDGDLDAVVGTGDGTLSYLENDGEGSFEEVTSADNLFSDIDVGRQSAPTFADLDGDGVLELVVGTSSGTVDVFDLGILASEDITGGFLGSGQQTTDNLLELETITVTGAIDDDNTLDGYILSVAPEESFSITLDGLTNDADLRAIADNNSNGIADPNEPLVEISNLFGTGSETISLNLEGDYIVEVYQFSGNTEYTLQFQQEFV